MINKLWDKRITKALWIVYALLSIVICFIAARKVIFEDYKMVSDRIFLSDDWNVDVNGEKYHDVSLKNFRFNPIDKKEYVHMETMLPRDWSYTQATMGIYINHSVINVYIDNELVYEYGSERQQQGKTVGSGYCFINLDDHAKGKKVRIEFISNEEDAFSKLSIPTIEEWNNAYRLLLTDNQIPLLLGCFFIVMGFGVVVVTIFAMLYSLKYARMLWLALFAVCIGIWTLCYYNVIQVFSIPLHSVTLMKNMTLFMAPIPLLLFMKDFVNRIDKRIHYILFWIVFGIQYLFTSIAITLHTLDIVRCSSSLKYLLILIVAELLYLVFIIIRGVQLKKNEKKLYYAGGIIVLMAVVYELVNFTFVRYLGKSELPFKGVPALGIFVLVFLLIIDFFKDVTKKMMEENERNLLIKRAYTDDLTQINNRRFCSEYMKEIMNRKEKSYTIFSFDLNDLKKVNDSLGHSAGDELIKRAAVVLKESFGDKGVVGRMGGDEFISIMDTADTDIISEIIDEFEGRIISENESDSTKYELRISYGYASSTEVDRDDIEKVYQLADDRMYDDKKRKKHR